MGVAAIALIVAFPQGGGARLCEQASTHLSGQQRVKNKESDSVWPYTPNGQIGSVCKPSGTSQPGCLIRVWRVRFRMVLGFSVGLFSVALTCLYFLPFPSSVIQMWTSWVWYFPSRKQSPEVAFSGLRCGMFWKCRGMASESRTFQGRMSRFANGTRWL